MRNGKIVLVDFKDLVLEVHGTYTPAEKEILYDSDGGGYSGAPAEFELEDVVLDEHSLWEITYPYHEQLTELAIEKIERDEL